MPLRLRASPSREPGSFFGSTLHPRGSGRSRPRASVRAALGLGVLALTLAVGSRAAYAATITVNTTADELNADGDCSLREAIEAANTNAAVDGCPSGDPAPTVDVITFGVTGTITLASTLPPISESLTIDGPGLGSLTVSGANSVRVLEVNLGAALALIGVTVANGYVNGNSGAGIFNHTGASLTVSGSVFSGNYAGFGLGGAIINDTGASLSVSDSTFSNNSAAFGLGGAIFNNGGGSVSVTNSTFSDNSAGGGGALANNGSMGISNSTFSGNSAPDFFGGAVFTEENSDITIRNSTLVANSAPTGGGLHNRGGVATLQNAIFANNSAENCSGGVTNDGGGNLSWPDATCPGLNQDPLLDPAGLQNNGGPTQTIALQPGSPAIDFAVACPPPTTDQRGVARPQGSACDSGAFELVPNNPPSCASVVASPDRLWPPNHKLRLITLSGATDPDGDTVTLTVTGVTQDEPISGLGPGDLSPDAQAGTQSNTVFVRAERSDTGDGRVYRISFMGTDGNGGTCSGTANVGVPKTQRSTPVDSAPPSYNSFGP